MRGGAIGRRRRAVVATVAVGCALTVGAACSTGTAAPPAPPLEATVRMSADRAQLYTGAMGARQAPDGATPVAWSPAYEIDNVGPEPLAVDDVVVEFPAAGNARGDRLRVVSAGPSPGAEVYRSEQEIQAGTAAPQPLPVVIEPGRRLLVRFQQYYTVTVNEAPVRLRSGQDLASYIGPLFSLPRLPDGRYQCSVGSDVRATVRSGSRSLSVPVRQPVLMDDGGCVQRTG